ncbi:MAG: hypothetical protein WDW38_006235 [Sanguina aurantia]
MPRDGRPSLSQFQAFLPTFLTALPSAECAKGGAGAYSDALQRSHASPHASAAQASADAAAATTTAAVQGGGSVSGLDRGVVSASTFRTYYTPLSRQEDFIDAMASVRAFTDHMRETLGLDVYSYSLFHIFFEQYLTIAADGAWMLAAPFAAITLTTALLTGSAAAALILALHLASLTAHLLCAMLLAGMQLNAVSLVNLVMALGIAVEFHVHILHAFCVASGGRPARASAALCSMGASVLSGITLTKMVGVAVLAGAATQIFEVYYFRLYLALVILGAAHGLVLLPVCLSLAGPPSWAQEPAQARRTQDRGGLRSDRGVRQLCGGALQSP